MGSGIQVASFDSKQCCHLLRSVSGWSRRGLGQTHQAAAAAAQPPTLLINISSWNTVTSTSIKLAQEFDSHKDLVVVIPKQQKQMRSWWWQEEGAGHRARQRQAAAAQMVVVVAGGGAVSEIIGNVLQDVIATSILVVVVVVVTVPVDVGSSSSRSRGSSSRSRVGSRSRVSSSSSRLRVLVLYSRSKRVILPCIRWQLYYDSSWGDHTWTAELRTSRFDVASKSRNSGVRVPLTEAVVILPLPQAAALPSPRLTTYHRTYQHTPDDTIIPSPHIFNFFFTL